MTAGGGRRAGMVYHGRRALDFFAWAAGYGRLFSAGMGGGENVTFYPLVTFRRHGDILHFRTSGIFHRMVSRRILLTRYFYTDLDIHEL